MPIFEVVDGDIIDIGYGETVTLRRELPWGARGDAQDLAMKGNQELKEKGEKDKKSSINWQVLGHKVDLELAYRMILAWTVKKGERIADLTRENLDLLPESQAKIIMDEIEKRAPEEAPEQVEKRKKA